MSVISRLFTKKKPSERITVSLIGGTPGSYGEIISREPGTYGEVLKSVPSGGGGGGVSTTPETAPTIVDKIPDVVLSGTTTQPEVLQKLSSTQKLREDIGGFAPGRKYIEEKGFLTLTPEEYTKTRGEIGTPFSIQKTGGGILKAVEVTRKGAFLGEVISMPTLFPGGTQPRETLIRGQTQINLAEGIYAKGEEIESEFKISPESFIGREGVETTETEYGKTVLLTPKYFESQFDFGSMEKEGRKSATKQFYELSPKTRYLSATLESATAITQLPLSLVEFGVSQFGRLGMATFKEPIVATELSTIKIGISRPDKFYFGGAFGTIQKQPVGVLGRISQGVVVLPIIPYAMKSVYSLVKDVGFKGAVIETAGAFSPLRIPKSYFGALEMKDIFGAKLKVVSFKKTGGEITKRVIYAKGTEEPIFLVSEQTMGKTGFGVAKTTIAAPVTEWRAATGFTEFTRVIQTEGLVSGKMGVPFIRDSFGKVNLESFYGSGSKSLSIKRIDMLFKPIEVGSGKELYMVGQEGTFYPIDKSQFKLFKGGGISKQLGEGVVEFTSGKGVYTKVLKPEGIFERVKISKLTISGYEIDLSSFNEKIIKGGISMGKISPPKGGSLSNLVSQEAIQQVATQKSISLALGSLETISPKVVVDQFPTIVGGAGAFSTFAGKGRYEVSTGEKFWGGETLILIPNVKDLIKVDKGLVLGGGLVGKSAVSDKGKTLFYPKIIESDIVSFKQPQIEKLIPSQSSGFKYPSMKVPAITFDGFGWSGGGRSIGFGFPPLILPTLGFQPERKTRISGKRRLERTPTFAAAMLGLTALKPSKMEFTGLAEIPFIRKPRKRRKKI